MGINNYCQYISRIHSVKSEAISGESIAQSKGHTPFLIFRYMSLTYLDFGGLLDSVLTSCPNSGEHLKGERAWAKTD